jgi:hypothetical protein
MRREKLQQSWWVQTCTADNRSTEFRPPLAGRNSLKKRIIYSSSYDDSFSVFFYAYASQFYDAFFSYHKAYSNIFLNLVYTISFKEAMCQIDKLLIIFSPGL